MKESERMTEGERKRERVRQIKGRKESERKEREDTSVYFKIA